MDELSARHQALLHAAREVLDAEEWYQTDSPMGRLRFAVDHAVPAGPDVLRAADALAREVRLASASWAIPARVLGALDTYLKARWAK